MILDTSVLIAIIQREPGWEELLDPDGVAVDADLARRALALYPRFGKGLGHAAQLNFGDCFAAALAQREPLPLAYAGGDSPPRDSDRWGGPIFQWLEPQVVWVSAGTFSSGRCRTRGHDQPVGVSLLFP